jgi:riboflavin kinase/FMN adenylyltransferase
MKKGLVLGFFDGVHKAHKAVISSALNQSKDVTLITFKTSPALYFGVNVEYLLSRKNSLEKIKKLGVKEIVELDFASIAAMPASEYLEYLIKTYNPISISTGFNHTFGANKQGTPKFLEENQEKYNYKYICTPPIEENGEIISSTLIRNYLKSGEIEKANSLLEGNFILEGEVIHGAKIGRTIGFPTANINYPTELVKIPFGVYKTFANIDSKKKNAIMNWGMKPTVNNTIEPVVEVHILNYDENLYGKNIKIEVIKQIRAEKKFNNLDELKAQISEDIKSCSES